MRIHRDSFNIYMYITWKRMENISVVQRAIYDYQLLIFIIYIYIYLFV